MAGGSDNVGLVETYANSINFLKALLEKVLDLCHGVVAIGDWHAQVEHN